MSLFLSELTACCVFHAVFGCTWWRQIQLGPPELRHGRLQLLDHKVVLVEEIFGQRRLQELHQLLHGQLHHVLY